MSPQPPTFNFLQSEMT